MEFKEKTREDEVNSDITFINECNKVLNCISISNGCLLIIEYYAMTDLNIKDLLNKYRSIIKKHPDLKLSQTILRNANAFKNDNYLEFVDTEVKEKVLRQGNVINGIELNEWLIDCLISELEKRNYQITCGVVYDAAKKVISNSNINEPFNFDVLDKAVIIEVLEKRLAKKNAGYGQSSVSTTYVKK